MAFSFHSFTQFDGLNVQARRAIVSLKESAPVRAMVVEELLRANIRLKPSGQIVPLITPAQRPLLLAIAEQPGISCWELAERGGMEFGGMLSTMDRLNGRMAGYYIGDKTHLAVSPRTVGGPHYGYRLMLISSLGVQEL